MGPLETTRARTTLRRATVAPAIDATHGGNFNYGQPLPPLAYGTAAQALQAEGEKLARDLGAIATAASARAWEVEMDTREVRIADTADKRKAAIAKLAATVARLRKWAPVNQGDPTPNYTHAQYEGIAKPAYTGQDNPGARITFPAVQATGDGVGEKENNGAATVYELMAAEAERLAK